jgi:hypothetical protein
MSTSGQGIRQEEELQDIILRQKKSPEFLKSETRKIKPYIEHNNSLKDVHMSLKNVL